MNMDEIRDELAEKYAQDTQQKLNDHFGNEIVSAWGPLAGAYIKGFDCASELLMKEIESLKLNAFNELVRACKLQDEVNMLKTKLKVAEAALEFYSERSHWGNGAAEIDPCDQYKCDLNVFRGGKRAREALAEIRKTEESKP